MQTFSKREQISSSISHKRRKLFYINMVPFMAATVLGSSVFVMFLFVFPVFCFSKKISFTRDELLNIRQNTPQNLNRILIIRTFYWTLYLADLDSRCLASICQISALYPTKWTNSFCSTGRISISETLLLRFSRKPGWMMQYRTARFICQISSWSDLIATQNQQGNCTAVGHAFTSMKGGVQM